MDQRDGDYSRHLEKKGDVVVFMIRQESACAKCGQEMTSGSLLTLREDQALCMSCAGMADLVLLPAGDPALTRRASKHSARRAVVVRWARARKRYERQGTLVEADAIDKARAECEADLHVRAAKQKKAAVRREVVDRQYLVAFTEKLKQSFPGCPADEAAEIAAHACEKYSGRVGRSAMAKELDEQAIRLAAIAHIRHIHTGYDDFLMSDMDRRDARRLVQAQIEAVLGKWERRVRCQDER